MKVFLNFLQARNFKMRYIKKRFLSLSIVVCLGLQMTTFHAVQTPVNVSQAAQQLKGPMRWLGGNIGFLLKTSIATFLGLAAVAFVIKRFFFRGNTPPPLPPRGPRFPQPPMRSPQRPQSELPHNPGPKKPGDDGKPGQRPPMPRPRPVPLPGLANLNVPEHIKPFVRSFREDGNVTYVQLHTVNQFAQDVKAPVVDFQARIVNQLKERNKVAKLADVPVQQRRVLQDFMPNATCPTQVIRNAKLMCDFLEGLDENNEQGTVEVLVRMSDAADANKFLSDEIERSHPVSWLHNNQIEQRINQNLETYGIRRDHISIVDLEMLVWINVKDQLEDTLRSKLGANRNGEDFSHTFIVSTAGNFFDKQMDESLVEAVSRRSSLGREDVRALSARANGVKGGNNHHYVVSIRKLGEQIYYYILDTCPSKNHPRDPYLCNANKFICEKYTSNAPTVDLRAEIKSHSERVVERLIHNLEEGKKVNVKKAAVEKAAKEKQSRASKKKELLSKGDKAEVKLKQKKRKRSFSFSQQ